MKKILLFILLLPTLAHASSLVIPTIYQNNGVVTAANLNGNFTAISQTMNGNLDNANANTTAGYRFYQTVAVLPAPGNMGAVYFLTTDDTLNFDTGSSFIKTVAVNTIPVQGDIIYYSASGWTTLHAGTSGQVLETLGGGANPVWTDGLLLAGTQTVTGSKTFSSAIIASAGVTGNLTGTVTGSINLNAGSITNGSLGQTTSGVISTPSAGSYTAPAGCYMTGYRKDGGGLPDELLYSCP